MKARCILHGRKSLLYIGNIMPKIMLSGFFVSAFVLFGEIYTADTLWENLPVREELLCAFCVFSGISFLFLYFFFDLHNKARLYFLSDSKNTAPEAICDFFSVIRYICFTLTVRTVRILWRVFFYLPFFTVVLILNRALYVNGMMIREMLYALVFSAVMLFVTGTVFCFFVTGRYYLCDMLFFRNPKQAPFEIIKTAVFFTRGRLREIAFYRIKLLFSGTGVFRKCVTVLIKEDIFYERRYYKKLGIESFSLYQSIPRAR